MKDGFEIFEYKRTNKDTGKDDFVAKIVLYNYDVVTFLDIVIPDNTPEEVASQFYEEAEKAAYKFIESDWEKKYAEN